MTNAPPSQTSVTPSERDAILRRDLVAFFEAVFPIIESSQTPGPRCTSRLRHAH
jgi:hypothetical protein